MAGRLILTTVGTSALNREKLEKLYLSSAYQSIRAYLTIAERNGRHREWVNGNNIPPKITAFIEDYLNTAGRLDIVEEIAKPTQGGTNVLPAEITSLYLFDQYGIPSLEEGPLGLKDDTLVFLLSDTAEGILGGLLNQCYLRECSWIETNGQIVPLNSSMEVVEGLCPDNFSSFFTEGLKRLSRLVRHYTQREASKKTILNATGGFKALVPYATYLTLVFGISMMFVFEEQPYVIGLNPVPKGLKLTQPQRVETTQEAVRELCTHNLGFDPQDV